MSSEDREKWNDRYRRSEEAPREPSRLLTSLDAILPRTGRALDVAGGAGRHAIWLAQRGLSVTLADVSPVGLEIAVQRAADAGVTIETCCVDLETEPFPAGPWTLIVSFHYLERRLFEEFPGALAPDGLLVFVQPTHSNLQRHARPPKRFLLADGELPELARSLEIVRHEEGWLAEGRHDALLVARRPSASL